MVNHQINIQIGNQSETRTAIRAASRDRKSNSLFNWMLLCAVVIGVLSIPIMGFVALADSGSNVLTAALNGRSKIKVAEQRTLGTQIHEENETVRHFKMWDSIVTITAINTEAAKSMNYTNAGATVDVAQINADARVGVAQARADADVAIARPDAPYEFYNPDRQRPGRSESGKSAFGTFVLTFVVLMSIIGTVVIKANRLN